MSGEDAIAQLGAKIDAQAAETRAQTAETRAQTAEIRARTAALNARIDAQTAETRADTGAQYAALNARIDAQTAELRSLCAELRALRWMFAGMLAWLGILTAGFVAIAVLAFDEPAPLAVIAVQASSAEDAPGTPGRAIPLVEPPSEESTSSPSEKPE